MRTPMVAATIALLAGIASSAGAQTGDLNAAFDAYWKADSRKEAEKVAERIVSSGAPFGSVYERLAEGRPYRQGVETGELRWATLPGGGGEHATTIVVPRGYMPTVKYPVRFFLHGGVARPEPADGEGEGGAAPRGNRPRRRLEFKERYIAVYPSGYVDAQWWFANQLANYSEILDRLKRVYNVDENRVHLMGVSDGGTGTFFAGLKEATPWSAFFPLNGFLRVLANPATRADGELFTTNLSNRPLYVVNGENDPLYPAIAAFPFMVMLKRAGTDVTFRGMPGAGHDTSWWPTESAAIDTFEEEHPRDPYPPSVSWETERTDRYNRIDWLVVDRLDASKTEGVFAENNTIEIQEPSDFGLRVDSRKDGRKIIDVMEGTTASEMGLRKGDTVMRMDEKTIFSAGDMGRAFDEHPPGTPLVFEIDRKGARLRMQGIFPPPPRPIRREEAFHHTKPAGRLAVVHKGNRFEARARGVAAFTLLLSPEMVNFDQPLTVIVNGRTAFEGRGERSVATLMKWASRDNDRTMLFGAELSVTVP